MNLLTSSRFHSIIAAVFLLMFCASECSIYALDVNDELVQLERESEDTNDVDETAEIKDQLKDVFYKVEARNNHFIAGHSAFFSSKPTEKTSLGVRKTLDNPPEQNA